MGAKSPDAEPKSRSRRSADTGASACPVGSWSHLLNTSDPWKLIEGEALKHGVDRCDMGVQIFCPCIDHMQEEVGITQFVQCRSEGCEEIFGQVANKSHRVGDDDFPAMRKMQSAARGIERFKDARGRAHLTVR